MKHSWMALLGALASPGCSMFGSPFEGSWLLALDLGYALEGDCASSDAGYTYSGEDNQLVDIYAASNDELVVLWEEILTGTYDSSSFEVDYEQTWTSTDGSRSELEQTVMTADRDGNTMSGEIEYTYTEVDATSSYSCQGTFDYEAEKVLSNRNEYLEN